MCKNRDAGPGKDLIQKLLLEVGRRMEDESAELAFALPREPSAITTRVNQVHRVASDIMALVNAAQALAHSIGDQPSQT